MTTAHVPHALQQALLQWKTLAILEKLNDAAAMFAGLPGPTDPDYIADFERGVRRLKRIIWTSR